MGDKGVLTFPKGIMPKVNVIAWLKYELGYCYIRVQHVSHYAAEIPFPHLVMGGERLK